LIARLLLVALLVAASVLAGACGDDDEAGGEQSTELAVPWLDPDGEFPIVGSLAINPGDDTLWISSNRGCSACPARARSRSRSRAR
jgi:hypothetical protein